MTGEELDKARDEGAAEHHKKQQLMSDHVSCPYCFINGFDHCRSILLPRIAELEKYETAHKELEGMCKKGLRKRNWVLK